MPAPSASLDLRPTLSLLWLFAILNMIFRDIHEFTTADTLFEILSGSLGGNPVTETALLFGAIAVELLLLGFLLSALLPGRWARRLNLGLVPFVVAGMLYMPPADPDDMFFAAVQLCALSAIFLLAWRWAPQAQAGLRSGGRYAA
jgi:hypothetical protein